MSIQIDQIDTRTADDDLLEELWLYYHEVFAEELPDDPPKSLARVVADWRSIREDGKVPRWTLRSDGRIVAVAVAYVSTLENLDVGFARLHVSAPHRGYGHARALAGPVFSWLEEEGRTKLHTEVNQGGAYDGFLLRLGMEEAYHDQRSRLVIADIDRDLMGRWVRAASERATAYRLLELDSPVSEEHLQRYCDIFTQMNTAPREGLDLEDEVMTPDRWRMTEKTMEGSGIRPRTIVAVHVPTGEFVGSTTVSVDLLEPAQGWQGETVVHPDHRNLGLGRWLKAAMIERLAEAHPGMQRIDTDNSVTNAAMLSINVAMGFRPVSRSVVWQGDMATVRANWGLA